MSDQSTALEGGMEGSKSRLALSMLARIKDARTLAQIDEHARELWRAFGSGHVSEAQATTLHESIEDRRRGVRGTDTVRDRVPAVAETAKAQGRPSHFPPRKKQSVSPDRRRSIERRRTLASYSPLPPRLAAKFTTSEQAVLQIIADEMRKPQRCCTLTLGEIAARAGVGITTARNTLQTAQKLLLLQIEERRCSKGPNKPNIVTVRSVEWLTWIKNGPSRKSQIPLNRFKGGGSKKPESTDTRANSSFYRERQNGARNPPVMSHPHPLDAAGT